MTIQFDQEKLLTFNEATKILPRRRAGRKPHISTLYRWANRGVNGIILETIQVGGTTCTSSEALQRFFERLNRNQPVLQEKQTKKSRTKKCSKAEEYLNNSGFTKSN